MNNARRTFEPGFTDQHLQRSGKFALQAFHHSLHACAVINRVISDRLIQRIARLPLEIASRNIDPALTLAVDEYKLFVIDNRHVLHAADGHEQMPGGATR